jgi:PTS system N-acetylglucosamine-specific IIC component
VTEPIEFSFMFLAPMLYALHAVMTGLAMVLADALGMRLGFSFSAGLFDYVINFGKATRPLLLLPLGAAYFALYYGVFRWAIVRFDLKTPGREPEGEAAPARPTVASAAGSRGRAFVEALGGAANLERIDACTTRLRLIVKAQDRVDTAALKALGARGFIRPSERDLQVVVGPIADEVAREMREAAGDTSGAPAVAAPKPAAAIAASPEDARLAKGLAAALGGYANLLGVEAAGNRVLLTLSDPALVDEGDLTRLGLRGIARPRPTSAQVVLDRPAGGLAAAIAALA